MVAETRYDIKETRESKKYPPTQEKFVHVSSNPRQNKQQLAVRLLLAEPPKAGTVTICGP